MIESIEASFADMQTTGDLAGLVDLSGLETVQNVVESIESLNCETKND